MQFELWNCKIFFMCKFSSLPNRHLVVLLVASCGSFSCSTSRRALKLSNRIRHTKLMNMDRLKTGAFFRIQLLYVCSPCEVFVSLSRSLPDHFAYLAKGSARSLWASVGVSRGLDEVVTFRKLLDLWLAWQLEG